MNTPRELRTVRAVIAVAFASLVVGAVYTRSSDQPLRARHPVPRPAPAPPRRAANPEHQASAGGWIRVGIAKAGGGYVVLEIPLETYVARVLDGEAVRDSRAAA